VVLPRVNGVIIKTHVSLGTFNNQIICLCMAEFLCALMLVLCCTGCYEEHICPLDVAAKS